MLDSMFNVDNDRFVESTKKLLIGIETIIALLINKGIITEEEYHQYKNECSKMVEKAFNDAKEQQIKEFKNKYPSFAKFMKGE